MSTTVPVTIRASALPSNWQGTPQQFLEAIAARLTLESTDDVSFFRTGSQLPTSDEGPFLLNGLTWYAWDVSTGAYIPQPLDFRSLRYIAQTSAPDPNLYTLWIVTDGSGAGIDLRYYVGAPTSAWVSLFDAKLASYATTAAMTSAIAAAVAGIEDDSRRYPAIATLTSNQTVPVNGLFVKLTMGTEVADPNSTYNAALSRYEVPVNGIYRISFSLQVDNDTGTASGMELGTVVFSGGAFNTGVGAGTSVASPPGARWFPSGSGLASLSAGSYIELFIRANDGVNSGNITVAGSNSSWSIELVQAT